ncbi:zinc-dependent metalloprotease, partial [Dermatophilus congolensis]
DVSSVGAGMSHNPDLPRNNGDDQPDFMKMLQDMMSSQNNPAFGEALKGMGINNLDPATMNMLAGQLGAFFASPSPDGLDTTMCTDIARKTAATNGDAVVPTPAIQAVENAVHLASLWIDTATRFDSQPTTISAWSRAEWIEATIDTWSNLMRPLAKGVTDAISSAFTAQLEQFTDGDIPPIPGMPALPNGMDMRSMINQMRPMLERVSGSIFSAQFGQAIGTLAGDVTSGTEVGLPLVSNGHVALLPANIGAFGEGLEIDSNEVLIYLAAREVARTRLFTDVPWLGPQLILAVQEYARDITIDTERIQRTVEQFNPTSMDPNDMNAMQEALAGELFSPHPSPNQQAALRRLETLLALVEGWVDVVTANATTNHLPHSDALGEAVRRRRATGGPAEDLFGKLVGLELRPRRMRDAANLFAALENRGGTDLRDNAWRDPESAPTAADLDDIMGYVARVTENTKDDIDRALEDLLSQNNDNDNDTNNDK